MSAQHLHVQYLLVLTQSLESLGYCTGTYLNIVFDEKKSFACLDFILPRNKKF